MKGLSLVALVLALATGYVLYQRYLVQGLPDGMPPQQQIDVVGVESDLRTMAAAERQFFASQGRYATLEQLASEGLLSGGTDRRGYRFTADVDSSTSFTIVAEPADPDKAGWPTMSIDESMQITRR